MNDAHFKLHKSDAKKHPHKIQNYSIFDLFAEKDLSDLQERLRSEDPEFLDFLLTHLQKDKNARQKASEVLQHPFLKMEEKTARQPSPTDSTPTEPTQQGGGGGEREEREERTAHQPSLRRTPPTKLAHQGGVEKEFRPRHLTPSERVQGESEKDKTVHQPSLQGPPRLPIKPTQGGVHPKPVWDLGSSLNELSKREEWRSLSLWDFEFIGGHIILIYRDEKRTEFSAVAVRDAGGGGGGGDVNVLIRGRKYKNIFVLAPGVQLVAPASPATDPFFAITYRSSEDGTWRTELWHSETLTLLHVFEEGLRCNRISGEYLVGLMETRDGSKRAAYRCELGYDGSGRPVLACTLLRADLDLSGNISLKRSGLLTQVKMEGKEGLQLRRYDLNAGSASKVRHPIIYLDLFLHNHG